MISKEFWIVFKQSQHWTQFFLKKGFGHCYVLFKDEYNWCVIDPKTYALEVQILNYPIEANVPLIIRNLGSSVVGIKLQKSERHYFKFLQFVTCVTLVKYVTNIKVKAFTPYQLYKQLKWRDNFKNITQSRVIL